EHRVRGGHQRLGEQRVGADRHHQQRLDLRPHHGAAGGERVGGGSGGGRADDAVAAEPGHGPPVDLQHDLQHPLGGHLLHGRLVERPVGVHDVTVAVHDDVDGHPLLDLVRPAHHAVDDLVEVVPLGFGEEADPAEVDAEHGDPGGPGELGAAQQGAVTAEHDQQLAAVQALRGGLLDGLHVAGQRQVARLVLQHPHAEPGVQQSLDHQFRTADGRGPPGVGEQENSTSSVLGQRGPSATARSTSAASSAPAPARSHRKYSTFPDGPGSGLAVTPFAPSPSSHAVAATPRTASARSSGLRTTPPLPSRSRPTSNCGFTIITRSASGRAHRFSAGSTSPSGMQDRSPTTRSTGSPSIASSVNSRTFVRSLTVTRSSLRRDQASWPYPTSTATTWAAPARSRTSVKPPVLAPASSARRPSTTSPPGTNASRAPASLWPPRET